VTVASGKGISPWVRLVCIGLFLISLVSAPAFGQRTPPASVRVAGSTTVQTIIEEIAEGYHGSTGVILEILGGGTGAGLEALRNGTADVCMASRSLTADEQTEFSYTTIAYDALAIIVNQHNPQKHITSVELHDIYTGRVRYWADAPPWATEIVLVSKQPGRGNLAAFEEFTGLVSSARGNAVASDAKLISGEAWEAGSNLDSILWVGGIPGAIGFVSIGAADHFIALGHPIRKLALDGVPAELPAIESGFYPMVRELNLVYRPGEKSALELVRYMGLETGRKAIVTRGYVPAGMLAKAGSP
jgi:phosphate transport system substrate-binding protein